MMSTLRLIILNFSVTATIGPMGRDVDALIEGLRVMTTREAYDIDPFIPPIAFNEQVLTACVYSWLA